MAASEVVRDLKEVDPEALGVLLVDYARQFIGKDFFLDASANDCAMRSRARPTRRALARREDLADNTLEFERVPVRRIGSAAYGGGRDGFVVPGRYARRVRAIGARVHPLWRPGLWRNPG